MVASLGIRHTSRGGQVSHAFFVRRADRQDDAHKRRGLARTNRLAVDLIRGCGGIDAREEHGPIQFQEVREIVAPQRFVV